MGEHYSEWTSDLNPGWDTHSHSLLYVGHHIWINLYWRNIDNSPAWRDGRGILISCGKAGLGLFWCSGKKDSETTGACSFILNFCPALSPLHSSPWSFFMLPHHSPSSSAKPFSLLLVQGHLISLPGPVGLRNDSEVFHEQGRCSVCFSTVKRATVYRVPSCALYFTLMTSCISYDNLLSYYYSSNFFLVGDWSSSGLNYDPRSWNCYKTDLHLNWDLIVNSFHSAFSHWCVTGTVGSEAITWRGPWMPGESLSTVFLCNREYMKVSLKTWMVWSD